MESLRHIASVSFGKDSLAMLLRLLEEDYPLDEVVFFDTGKEFQAIYDIRDIIQPYLELIGVKYTELTFEKSFDYYMFEHHINSKTPGQVKIGYGWCGGSCRWGTGEKLRYLHNYIGNNYQYIGIACDEAHRKQDNPKKKYPLIEWNMTEEDCLHYCYSKGFIWLEEGIRLYDVLDRVSCWCCRNKNLKELKNIHDYLPTYWDKLKILQYRLVEPMKHGKSIMDLEESYKSSKLKIYKTTIYNINYKFMISYKFNTPVEAWSELNLKFLRQDPELVEEGQGSVITDSIFTYGLSFLVENPEFDPDFDFGRIMGYGIGKWTGLLNNYLDLDALDQLKRLIRELESNKAVNRNYHIAFNFADAHDNGKGCLVAGTFSRMINFEKPRLTFFLRASDVVTRLPWDLLLACRVGEYVYGHKEFTIEFLARSAFARDLDLLMYGAYDPELETYIKEIENEERRKRMKKTLKRAHKAAEDATDPKYQASMRVYKILNPEAYGVTPKSLKASACIIGNWDGIPLPEECPSIIKRNEIKKVYLKFIEKYGLDIFASADKSKKVIKFSGAKGQDVEDTEEEVPEDPELPFGEEETEE